MEKKLLSVRDIKLKPENVENANMMFSDYTNWNYPRAEEIVTKLLNDIGISRMSGRIIYNVEELSFEEPTLIMKPLISHYERKTDNKELSMLINSKFYNIKGWNVSMKGNLITAPFDNDIKRLMYTGIPVGDYYPNRNLLILNFNMFPRLISLSIIKAVCDFLKEVLELNNVKIKNTFDREKADKINREKNIQMFMQCIDKRIVKIKDYADTLDKNIIRYNKSAIDAYGQVQLYKVELDSITLFRKHFKNTFEKQLKEVEELKFVNKVSLDSKGILIDVGNVSLGSSVKKTYIGYFSLLINPDKIEVLNKYSMRHLQHPHVSSRRPCLGTNSEGINKLLGQLNIKRLVFALYQFLHTYTPHGCYSGSSLTTWAAYRRKEGKFNSDGNLIKKVIKKI